jgi:hypothetical protein
MIIKSLSRKKATYGQILTYISKKSEPNFTIEHNVPFNADLGDVRKHFEDLVAQLPKRKNGNQLYHEILSIPRVDGVALELQQQALYTLCQQYIQCRAADHAVYGKMHLEGHHLHAHLVISPNSLDEPGRRVRIPKDTYAEIQKQLETWMLSAYPELKQSKVYTHDGPRWRSRPEREVQYEKRTGKNSQKAQLRLAVEHLLSQAESPEAFAELLQRYGLTLYMRGQVPGIMAENRKYRLSTLGLAEQFAQLAPSIELPPAPAPAEPEVSDRQPETPPTPEEYSQRRATLAAERLAHVLGDVFRYSPSREALISGLQSYGIEIVERGGAFWCLHESLEAPLEHMGVLSAYLDAWQRFAPDSVPEIPTPETRREKLEREHPEEPGAQMSERRRQLEEIRKQQENPDLDGPSFG